MRVNLDNLEQFDSGEDFAALFEASQQSEEVGAIKEVAIVKITDDSVMVNVGEKVEGRFPVAEIMDENGKLLFKENDKIRVYVTRGIGDRFSVSYKKVLRHEKVQEKIKELGQDYQDKIIEAKIVGKNRGGVVLEAGGVEYFMPKLHASFKEDKGKKIEVCVINVKPEENSIIVSRKRYFDLMRKNQSENAKRFMEATEPLKGVVKRIASFGMFVSVDGVEGLVHYTEITRRGPENPASLYKEGDEVQVKAIAYDEEKQRLSFSIKALQEDPWKEVMNELKVGYTIKVNVSNIEPYGAFVDIGNDLEGFLHISEISWDKNIKHPQDCLSVGQEIDVEIIEINPETRRLRVSLKKLSEKPFIQFAKQHKEGDVISGKVEKITDFGAFINIGSIDGLLHNEDVSWGKNEKCKDILKVGDSIEVKIIKIDTKNERVSLSKRALQESPTDIFAKKYKVDDVVEGEVVDIKDFGVFIRIDGVDALIRNEDLSGISKEEITQGMSLKGMVVNIDRLNGKIKVSMRRLEKQQEREEIKNFNSSEKMTLGDKLKGRI
ncbi:30S ribosomal protein S1 [Helicobacter sp. faydin-H20]|uniref:30S ribosomal protein S1 n=1 Tax=Helicobacter anatolicus TaxID=2905874 RepID=UPI001E648D3E|nr:30S ribosomal protein S1 [Helicobacter anatolicus]MCE3037168.1 30S ribosomal protein S1 [Helicobacter anatolicus]